MIDKDEFDYFIKKNLLDVLGNYSFGYEIAGRPYDVYYSREAYKKFIAEMQSTKYNKFYDQYNRGQGSELIEKDNKPPKMASVASSSRFCYLALRDGCKQFGNSANIIFEHGCKINGVRGTGAQLDAYLPEENIYFEVKCHEIFGYHKTSLSKSYWKLLYGQENDFCFPHAECPQITKFQFKLSDFGINKRKARFDVKQLLCHLLGIASQKVKNTPAKLVFLFFKPKMDLESEQKQVDAVFEELKDEIKNIFSSQPIQNFTSKNNIKLSAIAEYSKVMEPLSKENIIILF